MDDLKSFTYVLAVAECKSISKAAELLYISQPSLSRFISSLEQELGIYFRAEIEWNQSD